MSLPNTKISLPPFTEVALPRKISARVYSHSEHQRVMLGVSGVGRQILLGALESRPDFIALLGRLHVRVVPFVDGQFYDVPVSCTDEFFVEVERLIILHIPEMPD